MERKSSLAPEACQHVGHRLARVCLFLALSTASVWAASVQDDLHEECVVTSAASTCGAGSSSGSGVAGQQPAVSLEEASMLQFRKSTVAGAADSGSGAQQQQRAQIAALQQRRQGPGRRPAQTRGELLDAAAQEKDHKKHPDQDEQNESDEEDEPEVSSTPTPLDETAKKKPQGQGRPRTTPEPEVAGDDGDDASGENNGGKDEDEDGTSSVDVNHKQACVVPGARLWVSRSTLWYLRQAILPAILQSLADISVPDYAGDVAGWSYNLNNFLVKSVAIDVLELDFVEGVGISINAGGVRIGFSSRYAFSGTDWYNPIFSEGSLELVLGRGTQLQGVLELSSNYTGLPILNLTNVTAHVHVTRLDIQESQLSWILETLAAQFSHLVKDIIKEKLVENLYGLVNEQLQGAVNNMTLQFPIPLEPPLNFAAVDFSLCDIDTGHDYLSIGIKGQVYSLNDSTIMYPRTPTPLSLEPPQYYGSRMLTASLTKWVFNEGIYVFRQSGVLNATFAFNYSQDSSSHSSIPTKWFLGPREMTIVAHVCPMSSEDPIIELDEGTVNITVPTSMNLTIYNRKNGKRFSKFNLQVPVKVSTTMEIRANASHQSLFLYLEYLSVTPVEIVHSPLRRLPSWLINGFTEKLVNTALIPYVDALLKEGFPITSASEISLQRSSITISPDAIMGKSDVFLDPEQLLAHIFGEEKAHDAVQRAATASPTTIE